MSRRVQLVVLWALLASLMVVMLAINWNLTTAIIAFIGWCGGLVSILLKKQ